MRNIYEDGHYKEHNPNWHEEDAPWKARQIQKILSENGVSFDNVAEIGCGTGEILVQLSNMYPNARFSGYEISPHAFRMAEQKQRPLVSFHFGDMLQEVPKSYDVLLVIDVIEHVPDFLGFIQGVKNHAKLKVFHIPLDLSAQSLIRSWPILNLRKNVGHIHYFFKETAEAALSDCGYKIIDSRYTASRLELPNQALSSRLMALPRRCFYKLSPDLTVRVLGGYSLLVLAE